MRENGVCGGGLGEDSLSLTELPFMKMKLRMTKSSPIFSFSLSLRCDTGVSPMWVRGGGGGHADGVPPTLNHPGVPQQQQQHPLTCTGTGPRRWAGY